MTVAVASATAGMGMSAAGIFGMRRGWRAHTTTDFFGIALGTLGRVRRATDQRFEGRAAFIALIFVKWHLLLPPSNDAFETEKTNVSPLREGVLIKNAGNVLVKAPRRRYSVRSQAPFLRSAQRY